MIKGARRIKAYWDDEDDYDLPEPEPAKVVSTKNLGHGIIACEVEEIAVKWTQPSRRDSKYSEAWDEHGWHYSDLSVLWVPSYTYFDSRSGDQEPNNNSRFEIWTNGSPENRQDRGWIDDLLADQGISKEPDIIYGNESGDDFPELDTFAEPEIAAIVQRWLQEHQS